MSDQLKRLLEFQRAWIDADNSYVADISAASPDAVLMQTVDDNWWRHQANWAMAATAALEQTNDLITALHKDAKALNDRIERERLGAKRIPKLVRDSSAVAGKLAGLLNAVAAAKDAVRLKP